MNFLNFKNYQLHLTLFKVAPIPSWAHTNWCKHAISAGPAEYETTVKVYDRPTITNTASYATAEIIIT